MYRVPVPGAVRLKGKALKEIRICELKPFEGHPYKVIDNEEMDALVESIREHGIMTPLIVRPVGDRYEIISGHRRAHAAELAGLETVPAIEMEMTKDEAAIALVDSNLHRERLLPSEKAFAYKLKAEAMEHQGKSLTSGQVVPKSDVNRTTAVIGEKTGESYKTVQRYIRLTHLIPALLDMVDDGRIAFSVGVELSFLDSDMQAALMIAIDLNDCTPSYAQACRMHKAVNDGSISEEMIDKIMAEEKPNQKEKVSISADELRGYVPNGTPSEMKAFIRKACEHYSDYLKRKREEVR
ncbi:MAG: ParB/RepB/Spo0J family partition protein [Clostridia bacterium]|nr:ParB/RepB/Spo0J family partition protein [Clostridia bacterium]